MLSEWRMKKPYLYDSIVELKILPIFLHSIHSRVLEALRKSLSIPLSTSSRNNHTLLICVWEPLSSSLSTTSFLHFCNSLVFVVVIFCLCYVVCFGGLLGFFCFLFFSFWEGHCCYCFLIVVYKSHLEKISLTENL